MHGDLAGVERLAQLLDELEAIDGLLVHAGLEGDVASLAGALGFEQRDVGVLDQLRLVGARGVPENDAEAGVLLDGDVREREGFGEDLQQSLGDQLRILGRGEPFGEVQELVVARSAQRVRRT